MHTESAAPTATAPATTGRETLRAAVVVGALGVVFGDIGTSPIYTIQTVFNPADPHPVPISTDNVFGVVSLVFWSVMIIVTLTYVTPRDAREQRGRGRHHGADHPADPVGRRRAQRPAHRAAGLAGHLRRGAVLRRQHDHSGDLGALRGRGREGDRAGAGGAGRPPHRRDHRAAVRRPAAGDGRRRPAVRPGHDRLVRRDRRLRRRRHRGAPRDPAGALPDLRRRLPRRQLRRRLLRARRRRPRRHRRRGALRRHGALRPPGHHPRLAGPGPAGVHAQLLRPGRADPR